MQSIQEYDIVEALKTLENNKLTVNELIEGLNVHINEHQEIKKLFEQIKSDIDDIDQRAKKGKMRIGILGGRGSGKSKLANVLMGKDILPESAIIFCTNIPTKISYGREYNLSIRSEIEKYNFTERNSSPDKMKKILEEICKESENANNKKRINKISIEIPKNIFKGKEIVDVPGFTKANSLHQAFAERYAKYFCDLCLVLVNNPDSIQIGQYEGLEALAKCFADRLESTVFIINKCDASNENDIKYLEKYLYEHLQKAGSRGIPTIRKISAKNSLLGEGNQFEMDDLHGDLSYFSDQKHFFLVRSFLDRLASNLNSLKELCHLTENDLSQLASNFKKLLDIELDVHFTTLISEFSENNKKLFNIAPPEIKRSNIDIPGLLNGKGAGHYANEIIDQLEKKSSMVDEVIENFQTTIYESFNSFYDNRINDLNETLKNKMIKFESDFGIKGFVNTPEIKNDFHLPNFDPTTIEKLRPSGYKLYLEKLFSQNSIFVRDIKFWSTDKISVKVGLINVKIGIPIGLKSISEIKKGIENIIPQKALDIMNEHILSSLDQFAGELNNAYTKALDSFREHWKECIKDYLNRITVARKISSSEGVEEITKVMETLRRSSSDIKQLMH